MVLLLKLGDGETVRYDVENELALSVWVVGVTVGIFDENSEDESGSTLLLLDGDLELDITLVEKLSEDDINTLDISLLKDDFVKLDVNSGDTELLTADDREDSMLDDDLAYEEDDIVIGVVVGMDGSMDVDVDVRSTVRPIDGSIEDTPVFDSLLLETGCSDSDIFTLELSTED